LGRFAEEAEIDAVPEDVVPGDAAADPGAAPPGKDVPAEVLRAATAAFRTAGGAEAVADCVRDSLLAGGGVSRAPRVLEFRAPAGAVTVTVSPTGSGLALVLEVTPPVRCAVEVRQLSRDGELQRGIEAASDDHGRAELRDLPTGIASVAVRPADETAFPPFRTAWLRL
jgi:hypothetical protein